MRCAREAFDLLKASGRGSIINLSSVMATKHTRQMSVYSATKGAVSALSRSLAVEYAPYGIRVNALCPGYVETALIGRYTAEADDRQGDCSAQTPLRRFGTPQDIANAALFLASDEAAYITGAEPACRRRHEHYALAPCGISIVSSMMPSTTATSAACSVPPKLLHRLEARKLPVGAGASLDNLARMGDLGGAAEMGGVLGDKLEQLLHQLGEGDKRALAEIDHALLVP